MNNLKSILKIFISGLKIGLIKPFIDYFQAIDICSISFRSKAIKFKEIISYGQEMELTIEDTLTLEKFLFEIKLDANQEMRFKHIKYKK